MLNLNQQQAVKTTQGPVRIIAGAGTGKTHTLISRISYLINEKKVQPEKILALTFTNKAAHELNERLIEKNLPAVHAMTFHALAARLLRQFWNPDFAIITRKEQEAILSEILEQSEMKDIKSIISGLDVLRFKDPSLTDTLINQKSGFSESRLRSILKEYIKALNEKNAADFTGLLSILIALWDDRPDILYTCRSLYSYILVDEYQDVNPQQIKIVTELAHDHHNICIVGDPDQTIYSWRGAKAETMTLFERLYPDALSVSLTKNYRNPPAVLQGAEKLIANNIGRLKKTLQPTLENKEPITFWETENEWRQMEALYHLLEKFFGSQSAMHMADHLDIDREKPFHKFGDIALLYRTQAQGRFIYDQLIKRGYPCQMSAPDAFWQKKEIIEFLEAAENLMKWTDVDKVKDKFSKWVSDKIDKFIHANNFSKSAISNLNHLVSYSLVFDNLTIKEALMRFLDEARTDQEADNLIQAEKISLLTLHAAKGLEFPVVMIFGLEEGNIPHRKLKDDTYWLEEERRLLYVGMTRATEELHLFMAKKSDDKINEPSKFLKEIGHENLIPGVMPEVKIRQIHRQEVKKAQMKLF